MGSSTRAGKLSSRAFQRCREGTRDELPVDRAEQNVEKREGKKKGLGVPRHAQVGLVLREMRGGDAQKTTRVDQSMEWYCLYQCKLSSELPQLIG